MTGGNGGSQPTRTFACGPVPRPVHRRTYSAWRLWYVYLVRRRLAIRSAGYFDGANLSIWRPELTSRPYGPRPPDVVRSGYAAMARALVRRRGHDCGRAGAHSSRSLVAFPATRGATASHAGAMRRDGARVRTNAADAAPCERRGGQNGRCDRPPTERRVRRRASPAADAAADRGAGRGRLGAGRVVPQDARRVRVATCAEMARGAGDAIANGRLYEICLPICGAGSCAASGSGRD